MPDLNPMTTQQRDFINLVKEITHIDTVRAERDALLHAAHLVLEAESREQDIAARLALRKAIQLAEGKS